VKRSAGVTISAVLVIIGGALLLLLAAIGVIALLLQPGALSNTSSKVQPPPFALMVLGFAVLALLAAWAIATGIGLFMLQPWSRWSIVIGSGFITVMGILTSTVMFMIPTPPGTPPAAMATARTIVVIMYGLPALLGIFWLWFFNRASVKVQFTAAGDLSPDGTPAGIYVLAVILLAGAVSCVIMIFTGYPASMFGFVATGWAARALFLAIAACQLFVGLALWRLQPAGRIGAIAFFAFGIVNNLSLALIPGSVSRLMGAMRTLTPQAQPIPATGHLLEIMLIFGAIVCALPIWWLIRRRAVFYPPIQAITGPAL
jgi:hypothetical protein